MKPRTLFAVIVLVAGLLPAFAHAQSARAMKKEVEGTMLVTGTVDVEPDGTVAAHALDEQEKLPAYVVSLIARAVPALRFEPIEGGARARAKMSLRLVATPDGTGDMRIAIRSAHFGEEAQAQDGTGSGLRITAQGRLEYPVAVARVGGKGTVYLLLRIGRDGKVADAVAEQVNLTALGSAREMATIRAGLSRAAIEGITRGWRFAVPTEGEEAGRDFWVARVTVDYTLDGVAGAAYGQWNGYHPGERQTPAWAAPTPPGFSPDALASGDFAPEGSRFRLLSSIGG